MAKRNLARTTRKHGRLVEDLMMRYLEHKVCAFSVIVLDSNNKSMEILIPKANQVPKMCEFSLHLMLDSFSLLFGMMVLASGAPGARSWVISNNSSIHLYQAQRRTTGCELSTNTWPLNT
jgi:hypothetical protein